MSCQCGFVQASEKDTILSCYRLFVDTVPRVHNRAVPPEANYTGRVQFIKVKRLFP